MTGRVGTPRCWVPFISGEQVDIASVSIRLAAVHADRILVMDQGAVVAEGGPREVLEADLLIAVHDQPLVVVEHPFRDCPLVLTAKETRPT